MCKHKQKFYLILIFLFVSALASSQGLLDLNAKLYFNNHQYKLEKWISDIEKQINVKINYSPSQILNHDVILDKNELTIQECLDVLKNQYKVDYFIDGNIVYLLKNYSNVDALNSISGYVKDSRSGEALIASYIRLQKSKRTVLTDESGYFNIEVDNMFDSLEISYVGYKPLKISLEQLNKNFNSIFELSRSAQLGEVIIKDDLKSDLALDQMIFKSSLYDIQNIVSVLGTGDLMNELTFLPGIAKINDFQGGISINGLAPENNCYYLDGVRIYEPNHIFGLFSAFNSNPVNKVSVYSNNLPGRYSGALSSVIDSHLKEGNIYHPTGSASLSLSEANVFLSGPLIKQKTSFILDFRKNILNYYIPGVLDKYLEFDIKNIDFYDVNLKLTHRISPANKINFIFYKGRDNLQINNIIENKLLANNSFNWSNQALALKWNAVYKDDLTSELKLSMSNYDNNSSTVFKFKSVNNDDKYLSIISKNNLRDISLNHQLKYYLPSIKFEIGYSLSKYNISPLIKSNIAQSEIDPQLDSGEDLVMYFTSANVDFSFDKYKYLTLKGNAVFNYLFSGEYNDFYINPAVDIIFKTGKRSYVKFGYGKTAQFLHSLGSYSIGIPSMLWVGSDANIPVSRMHNFNIIYNTQRKKFNFSTELYYKLIKNKLRLNNLTDVYNPFSSKGVVLPVFNNWESESEFLNLGSGYAYGFNLSFEYLYKGFQSKISASTNRVFYNFAGLNKDLSFPGKYDMLYSVSWMIKYKFKKLEIFSSYNFHSGGAFTFPENISISASGEEILNYSAINNTRFNDFHSFSLGLSSLFDLKSTQLRIDMGFTNIFNHYNPVYAYIYKHQDYYKVNEISGFPILPYIKIKTYFN